MIAYAVIMLLVALLFGVVAMQIGKGKVELIHDYHRKHVTDIAGYGKAIGRVLGIMAGTMALSSGIALLGESAGIVWSAIAVLGSGFALSIVCFVRVQKRYNGGVFS